MNSKHNILTSLLSVLCIFQLQAQQVPFYNHNILNPVVFNPAYAGANGHVNAYVVRGQRYMGFGTGAINNSLSIDGDFFVKNLGVGLLVGNQSIGIFNQLNAVLSLAYKINFGEEHNLRFGVSGGYMDNRLRTSEINVMQVNDPYILGMSNYSPSYNFNFGLAYQWKGLKIGLSVPQLIGNKVKFVKGGTRGYYTLARHFMGTVSYDFKFKNVDGLTLTPYFLARYVIGAPFQYNATARIDYEKIGWFSATYKSDYSVQFNLGFHILKCLHIGYSYELVIGSFKNYYTGVNHEFLLGYTFRQKKQPKPVEIIVPDTSLQKVNDSLRTAMNDASRIAQAREDSLQKLLDEALKKRLQEAKEDSAKDATIKNTIKPDDLREAGEDYHFEETNGSESPFGYYVVVGVFAETKNRDNTVSSAKDKFSDTYYVINNVNHYDYVVIKYTKKLSEAYDAYKNYKENVSEKVWILNYNKK
jgi:type IX secretion system PorP/SprF family membrane protein